MFYLLQNDFVLFACILIYLRCIFVRSKSIQQMLGVI